MKARIWIDPSIPRPPSFPLMKSIGILPHPTTVSHLFDPATHDLNEHLVESLFDASDCDAILSIPTSHAPFDDEIVWHFTKSGKFSVKSAYHLAFDSNQQHLPSSSGSTSDLIRDGWRGILNAKIRQRLDQQEFQLFLIICWSIWWSRNRKWTENELISPEQMVSHARH
ncbi:UNVERIFIED_CONTAM: hypothetical protein Sradi_7122400 [Sesamum radiatum]|uniref:Reverse transcriptase zinc-binding domain-containing protein n=1 Tax=Sesamum radiatum TaxID=300843 RepID=A0AAW2J0B7_SESRA